MAGLDSTASGDETLSKVSSVEKLQVFDGEGEAVEFGELYRDQKTIVIFVREYVQDLAKIPSTNLEEVGVKLAVVGCAPHKFIKGFRSRTEYQYELYCDPEQTVYNGLGMIRTTSRGGQGSEHIKSSFLGGTLRSTLQAAKGMQKQGDFMQQGGQFVLGPGPQVHYFHLDAGSMDHTPINTLLEAAGVKTVDFSQK